MQQSLYAELHRLASVMMADERRGHTLQPTALVNEAWLRLGEPSADVDERRAFVARSATAMRRVLVDHARKRNAEKRGDGRSRRTLVDGLALAAAADVDLLDLEAALERLEERDASLVRVVELRFFGGLTLEEVAAATQLSVKQVRNAWDLARALLRRELDAGSRG